MNCRYCGTPAPKVFTARDENRRITAETFDYYECPACGLVFLGEVPPNLGTYYPADYHHFVRDERDLARHAEAERYKIDLVNAHATRGRLVEVGPGNGGFAYLAKAAGYDVTGIDMSARVCEFLRDIVKVDAIHSEDEVAAVAGAGPADVIVLWQVLEHVAEPWTLVRAAARSLRPGGVLVIATPNPRSAQRRWLGRRWVHLDAPRHIALMPIALVERMGREAGLVPVVSTTRDRGSREWNAFGWRFLAKNAVTAAGVRASLVSKGAQAAGLAFARAIRWWEDREGVGTAFTTVLRKP